jgi:hypothetical protein
MDRIGFARPFSFESPVCKDTLLLGEEAGICTWPNILLALRTHAHVRPNQHRNIFYLKIPLLATHAFVAQPLSQNITDF